MTKLNIIMYGGGVVSDLNNNVCRTLNKHSIKSVGVIEIQTNVF